MELKKASAEIKYSIVVVSYNTITDLANCVDSIFSHTKDFQLIIVDNGSKDGSNGYLQDLNDMHENVTILMNYTNYNFGPANNQGIQHAEGEKIILLNSDTIVTPGWAESMAYVMDAKGAAIVGPVSNSSNGRQGMADVYQNGVDAEVFSNQWAQRNQGKYEEAGVLYGWCLMCNREFLKDEPYLFDEKLINSYEDNDLSLRARLKGWKLYIDYSTFIS